MGYLGVLTGEERSHLRRSASDGLDHNEAAVLFQIARGFASVGLFNTGPGAQAVRSLQRQGLIERNRGSFVLSSDVAFSLGLDD